MIEEEQPRTPKFREGDEVYVGNKLWYVSMVYSYGGGGDIYYDLTNDHDYYASNRKFKQSVSESEVHRLPLHERLARIEAALGLE